MILFLDKTPAQTAFSIPDEYLVTTLEEIIDVFTTYEHAFGSHMSSRKLMKLGLPQIVTGQKEYDLVEWIINENNMSWLFSLAVNINREIGSIRGLEMPEQVMERYFMLLDDFRNIAGKGDSDKATVPPLNYFMYRMKSVGAEDKFTSPIEFCRWDLKNDTNTAYSYTIRVAPTWLTSKDSQALVFDQMKKEEAAPEESVRVTNFKSPEGSDTIDPAVMKDLLGKVQKKYQDQVADPDWETAYDEIMEDLPY